MLYFQFTDGFRMLFFDASVSTAENIKLIRAVASEGRKRRREGRSPMGKILTGAAVRALGGNA
jgi:hypothetical protein